MVVVELLLLLLITAAVFVAVPVTACDVANCRHSPCYFHRSHLCPRCRLRLRLRLHRHRACHRVCRPLSTFIVVLRSPSQLLGI